VPNPKDCPSQDKYVLDSAEAFGYARAFAELISFLNNQKAILDRLIKKDGSDKSKMV